MIDRFEKFSLALSEIYRDWHKIASDELSCYGLKSSHAIYLATMTHYKEGISATKLCEICGKDKADVSRMMRILVLKGLAVKRGGFHKGYGGLYMLTKEGERAAQHVISRAALAVELAGKDLSDENRKIFYESLDSIVKNLREMEKNGLPGKEI